MKKFMALLLILTAVLVSGSFSVQAQEQRGVNIFETPRDVPTRPIYLPSGKKIQLSDFKGDFVIAVFWSRYCAPCLREIDNLANYQKIVKNDGIRVILISPDTEWNSAEQMQKMARKYGSGDLELFTDVNGELASDLGIFTSPNTVLLNKDGKEIGRIRGSAEWDSKDVVEYLYKIKAEHNG